MTNPVPRGTRSAGYPTTAADWPRLLEAQENAVTAYECPDPMGIGGGEKVAAYAQQVRREKAAGYAHIDRLSIDGGPMVQPRPIRRRLLTDGLPYIVCVGLGVIAIIFTALELLR